MNRRQLLTRTAGAVRGGADAGAYAGNPGFGTASNRGQIPVGWGNGDRWLARFQPILATGNIGGK